MKAQSGGDTVIIRLEKQMVFGSFPSRIKKPVSGCVMDQEEIRPDETIARRKCLPESADGSAVMRARMKEARAGQCHPGNQAISPTITGGLIGPRLLRVGDAAGFHRPDFFPPVFTWPCILAN